LIGAVICQRTDRHDEANGRFSLPKNERENEGHPSDPKAFCVGYVNGPRPEFEHCLIRYDSTTLTQSFIITVVHFHFSVLLIPLIQFFAYCVLRCW